MNRILEGLRIVEGSAFVAAPLWDDAGAAGRRRHPLRSAAGRARRASLAAYATGKSLYWVGLNKGKRSLAVDTRSPEGQELVVSLITQPGEGAGIFLTNFPASGWLGYESLRQRRPDLIMMNLFGNPDGSSAVDYTVNCAIGIPFATGPSTATSRSTRSTTCCRRGMRSPA